MALANAAQPGCQGSTDLATSAPGTDHVDAHLIVSSEHAVAPAEAARIAHDARATVHRLRIDVAHAVRVLERTGPFSERRPVVLLRDVDPLFDRVVPPTHRLTVRGIPSERRRLFLASWLRERPQTCAVRLPQHVDWRMDEDLREAVIGAGRPLDVIAAWCKDVPRHALERRHGSRLTLVKNVRLTGAATDEQAG